MAQKYYRVYVSLLVKASRERKAEELARIVLARADDIGAVVEYSVDDVEDDTGPDE